MGDTGSGVLETQQMLRDLGYAMVPVDGTFDTSTLRAVIAFQSDQSLPVDGVVAVNTWVALRKQAGHHEEPSEAQVEREEHTSRQERPPATVQLVPLEEPESYVPPLPIMPPPSVTREVPAEDLPSEPAVFVVATVPLIQWKPIHEDVPVLHGDERMVAAMPSPEPEAPREESVPQPRGWTRVSA